MIEIVEKYGFVHYATGCPCNGLGKFYKHENYPNYRIITKAGFGIIKRNGVEIYRTKKIDDFEKKLKEIMI